MFLEKWACLPATQHFPLASDFIDIPSQSYKLDIIMCACRDSNSPLVATILDTKEVTP